MTVDQNLVLAYIPLRALPQVYGALDRVGLAEGGAHQIEDVTTCPGAYSCNLALTKSMNLGAALAGGGEGLLRSAGSRAQRSRSAAVLTPAASTGSATLASTATPARSTARKCPYYLMLLGGGYDGGGVMRFGVAIQSIPARLAPEAVRRVLDHYMANRQDGESFREYVLRHKVETFRGMTNDLVKPPELAPEMYRDWGDEHGVLAAIGPRRVRQLAVY